MKTIKNSRLTTIKSFIVTKPMNEMETVGEILELSMFGEYCPNNSLRGYSLWCLLSNYKNYHVYEITQKGVNYIVYYNGKYINGDYMDAQP